MVRGAERIDISGMPDLARLVQEVAATGTPYILEQNGTDLAILTPTRGARVQQRGRTTSRRSTLDSVYQAVPALAVPRGLNEMTELAAEEHAEEAARAGLASH